MDWQEHFGTVFFETWRNAGLPNYQDFSDDYVTARKGLDFENIWIQQPYESSPALEENLLRSVYGFGALHGKMFSKLLNSNDEVSKNAADWCGRFNLGISLFDYLCDETVSGHNSVTSLNVFQPFVKTEIKELRSFTPTEEFLSNLARSVLQDIEKLDFRNEETNKSNHLFQSMKQLFEAQSFLSKNELSDSTDLKKIKKSLYQKSAGPFKLMAEYTLGLSRTNDPLLLKNARSIGKAIGHCYWLIDDAKDVWIDLEAKQWNLFLQLAAVENTQIFSNNKDRYIRDSLLSIWKKEQHAEKISEQIVKRLVKAINKLEVSQNTKDHSLGLLSASLWYWYK